MRKEVGETRSAQFLLFLHVGHLVSSLGSFSLVGSYSIPSRHPLPPSIRDHFTDDFSKNKRKRKSIKPQKEKVRHEKGGQ